MFEDVKKVYEGKINFLTQGQSALTALLDKIETFKITDSQKQEDSDFVQRFYSTTDIRNEINTFQDLCFETSQAREIFATLKKIETAVEYHQALMTALEKLKRTWPRSLTNSNPQINSNIQLVQTLLDGFLTQHGNYLALSSEDRAQQYQHALKVLGEDKSISELNSVRDTLLETHQAYEKARDSIHEIRKTFDSSGSSTSTAIYKIKGFDLAPVTSSSSSSSSSGSNGRVVSPPPMGGNGFPPPPPPSISPPPPPLMMGGAMGPVLSERQREQQEEQRWLTLYQEAERAFNRKHTSSSTMVKGTALETVKTALIRLIEAHTTHFDDVDITYNDLKRALETSIGASTNLP